MEEQKEIKQKKPIYKRWWFTILAIIIVVGMVSGDDEETKATTDTKVKTEQTDTKSEQKKHRELVLEFEKQLYATEDYAKPALESYEQVVIDLENGKADISKAYDAASSAKDAADVMYTALRKVEISEDLPQEVKSILAEARDDIRSSYFMKKEGLESAMEFLDNKNQNNLQNAKKNFEESQSFMLNGSAKLLEAKEKVGISVDEKK